MCRTSWKYVWIFSFFEVKEMFSHQLLVATSFIVQLCTFMNENRKCFFVMNEIWIIFFPCCRYSRFSSDLIFEEGKASHSLTSAEARTFYLVNRGKKTVEWRETSKDCAGTLQTMRHQKKSYFELLGSVTNWPKKREEAGKSIHHRKWNKKPFEIEKFHPKCVRMNQHFRWFLFHLITAREAEQRRKHAHVMKEIN